ncbi:hypothetical protein BGX28_006503 [Mortierella sp. GBA30]|nr:hypothetical protein BGX28_006503 [Mortierella sp. GBA30]
MATKANTTHGMPVGVTDVSQQQHSQHPEEDWPIESQKVKDEQIQAFYREYAKRIATALTQHTSLGKLGGNAALLEETLQDPIIKPSQEELMDLYTTLIRDNQVDMHPKIKQVLTDQSLVVSSFTSSLAERLEKQLTHPRSQTSQQHPQQHQRAPCGCAIGHGDHGPLDFPDDSYEDEPDEESFDDEDDDDEDEDDDDYDEDDEDDDDEDDEDDSPDDDEDYDEEEYDDLDDDGVIDGYSNHYANDSEVSIALEEERRKFVAILKRRDEGKRRLEEEFRRKNLLNIQKRKLEAERIQLLQRLRLEDEERRKKELQEKERREKQEQEMRRKREAAEADQTARSFLFESTRRAHTDIVKRMIETTPAESQSLSDIPTFPSTIATRLTGWEYMTVVEGDGEVCEKRGIQETLLHVAARAGCLELVEYFILRGAPLDALDAEGQTPLHTAAENSAPIEVLKLLLEKGAHYMDRSSGTTGKTALHYAAQTGNGALVALLLQHHARISVVDANGNTPEMLAKAGLEREKGSKAKAKMYREALQYIQKAVAVIKEAQRQRDAALEEQRKREEELAREEAEKDRAARRKQEEKLEADKRRREEEEKELARLKALATDPHNHSSGGGAGKKKKKKKTGKGGNDNNAVSAKETTSTKTPLSAPLLQNALAKSNSPSPMGSPAISQATTQSMSPSASQPTGHSRTAVVNPILTTTPLTTTIVKPAVAYNTAATHSSKPMTTAPAASSRPTRLPKARTSYRPSPLVVARMADMGFPERDSRKALIQTEGRFEEAIELLTSGAPLADDSEDEAEEKAAKEASRKARANEAVLNATVQAGRVSANSLAHAKTNGGTPSSSTNTSTASRTGSSHQPLDMPHVLPGSAPAPALSTSGPGSKQAPPSKGPISHPVQILQRTHAPHVQMRSVPTQVLQRPTHHAASHAAKTLATVASNAPQSTSTTATTTVITTTAPAISSPVNNNTPIIPFLAPRANPPPPPTRAPYSYGSSSSAQNQKQSDGPQTSTSTLHPGAYVRPGARAPMPLRDTSVSTATSTPSTVSNDSTLPTTFDLTSGYGTTTSAGMMWDTQLGISHISSASDLYQMPINMSGYAPSTVQDNLWGSSSLLQHGNIGTTLPSSSDIVGAVAGADSPYFQSSLLINSPSPSATLDRHYGHTTNLPSKLIAASMNEMLRQSQMDMMMDLGNGTDSGGDMIKDVLAMTGAIDADELAESFATAGLPVVGSSSSSAAIQPSDVTRTPAPTLAVASAVGEGRTVSRSTTNNSNPVASLWGYGAFTPDIEPILNQTSVFVWKQVIAGW